MRFAARAAMTLVLLAGVYAMALTVVAALVAAVCVAAHEATAHGVGGLLVVRGLAASAFVLAAAAEAVRIARRSRTLEPGGVVLTPEEHPVLWDEVRTLAARVGTRAPDELRLVPDVNAAVAQRWRLRRWPLSLRSERVMYVGGPLLVGLTRQQLRAVLAHELGHYSHGHTALAAVAYRGRASLSYLVRRLGPRSLPGRLLVAYARLYARVTSASNRRQELEADAWSYRVAGRAPSASALRELPALDAAWAFYLGQYAFAVPTARPEALFDGFRQLLAAPGRSRELDKVRAELPAPPPDWYDSHPPLPLRVEFLDSLPEDGVQDDGTPAVELAGDGVATLLELERWMFRDSDRAPHGWQWLGEHAGLWRARERAALLVRATAEVGHGATTLRDAVVSLGRRHTRQLVRPLVSEDASSTQVADLARLLVTGAVAAALVEHCGARFTLDWDDIDALVDPDGRALDVRGLVATVTDRDSADRLLELLAAEGVPPTFAVDPAEVEAARALPTAGPVTEAVEVAAG